MSSRDRGSNTGSRSTRRQFLGRTAAAVTTASLLAGTERAPAQEKAVRKVTGRVLGANDKINIGFIGCGMQFLSLLRGFQSRKDKKGDVELLAVCDVWEPRLKNAQEKTKAPKTYKDFRELLAQPDIDGVVIAVPDHWHYPMAREALLAGKDVYLEKPMTYTIDEAAKLNDLVNQTKRILQNGGSGPAQRINWKVNEYIRAGKMGKILWGLISYNRNTRTGMWDYPIPGVGSEPWPDAEFSEKNIDWKLWIGSAPKRALSAERYFRWRKYWDYSGGNATDLLFHRLGSMCTMIGFDFPTRVIGAGGIYVQKNREVPDVYMTMAEYPGDYCINMISCMANQESSPVMIYGNWGTLQVGQPRTQAMDAMGDVRRGAQPQQPMRFREQVTIRAEREFEQEFKNANDGKTEVVIESEPGDSLGDNWLNCMRSREQPVYDVLRGYQVMVAIKLGVDSYREGKVMAFDSSARRMLDRPPSRKVFLPPGA